MKPIKSITTQPITQPITQPPILLGRKRVEDRAVIKSVNKTICMTPATYNGLVELAKRIDIPPATLGRKIIEAKVEELLK